MEKSSGSRLLQMQARFQQKQLQERELKIASLYEAQQARALDRVRHSPSTGSTVTANGVESSPPPQIPHQPGKVRQMFEERRTKGIDKSYPLQPIHNTERTATKKALPNGYSKVTHTSNGYTKVTNTSSTTSKVAVERKNMKTSISSHEIKKQHVKNENLTNGSGDVNHNHETDINSNKHAVHVNGQSVDELDRVDNNYLLENETFPEALAPIPTPRSPEPKPPQRQRQTEPEPKKPPRRSPASKSSPTKTKVQPPPTAPPRRVISDNAVSENKARGAMQRAANPVLKRKAVASPVQSGSGGGNALKTRSALSSAERAGSAAGAAGDACSVCGRRFASDRLAKHEEICRRAHAKKRKPFDALKHRLAGTEAEPFINKLRKNTGNPSTTKVNKNLNNNWRQKHEEFISAIRAAKQVQAHLKAGGKLSDLPPPPPSENPDYVQCPHCNRRFNQAAAERHIPKCANFQFNKPKPTNKRR